MRQEEGRLFLYRPQKTAMLDANFVVTLLNKGGLMTITFKKRPDRYIFLFIVSIINYQIYQIHPPHHNKVPSLMDIITIPLNSDNFGYLVICEETKNALIVDVSNNPDQVFAVAQSHNVNIKCVLSTHKHWDHSGRE